MRAVRLMCCAAFVCYLVISVASAATSVRQQLSPHLQEFDEWKVLIEGRAAQAKAHLAGTGILREFEDKYLLVQASVNPLLNRLIRDLGDRSYADVSQYTDAIRQASRSVEDYLEFSSTILATEARLANVFMAAKGAAEFVVAVLTIYMYAEELNAREDYEFLVAELRKLLLRDFAAIQNFDQIALRSEAKPILPLPQTCPAGQLTGGLRTSPRLILTIDKSLDVQGYYTWEGAPVEPPTRAYDSVDITVEKYGAATTYCYVVHGMRECVQY